MDTEYSSYKQTKDKLSKSFHERKSKNREYKPYKDKYSKSPERYTKNNKQQK